MCRKHRKITNFRRRGTGHLHIRPFPIKVFKAIAHLSIQTQENRVNIVEAHLLDRTVNSTADFYGSTLKLCLVGFMRPEKKFDSFPSLIAQINADIQLGRDLSSSTDVNGPLGTGREIARKFFESSEDSKDDDLIWRRIKNL